MHHMGVWRYMLRQTRWGCTESDVHSEAVWVYVMRFQISSSQLVTWVITHATVRVERELTPFSTVLSQNAKRLVSAQLHPRGTKQLMSNIHFRGAIIRC